MAAVHGKAGSVTFVGGVTTKVQSWSLDTSGDIAESTAMGDSWQSYVDGLTTFTASVECLAQTETEYTGDIGISAALTLMLDAADDFIANAVCTGITESCSVDDVGKCSMSFIGNDTDLELPA